MYKAAEKRTGKVGIKNSNEFYPAITIDKVPTVLFYPGFMRR